MDNPKVEFREPIQCNTKTLKSSSASNNNAVVNGTKAEQSRVGSTLVSATNVPYVKVPASSPAMTKAVNSATTKKDKKPKEANSGGKQDSLTLTSKKLWREDFLKFKQDLLNPTLNLEEQLNSEWNSVTKAEKLNWRSKAGGILRGSSKKTKKEDLVSTSIKLWKEDFLKFKRNLLNPNINVNEQLNALWKDVKVTEKLKWRSIAGGIVKKNKTIPPVPLLQVSVSPKPSTHTPSPSLKPLLSITHTPPASSKPPLPITNGTLRSCVGISKKIDAKVKVIPFRAPTLPIKSKLPNQIPSSSSSSSASKSMPKEHSRTPHQGRKFGRPIVLSMPKPQEKFSLPVDNSTVPFKPVLTFKPNSLSNSGSFSPCLKVRKDGTQYYEHPYAEEISAWKPSDLQLKKVKLSVNVPKFLVKIEDTPFELVSSPGAVLELLEHLKTASEIAVDLEHHDSRSFLGLTCLIQISTRTRDYIIDGLALHRNLECLNIIFTNPRIIKVFHGARSDIGWLQRDFGLYIVGMFDTCIAGEYLYGKQVSLKYLLEQHAGVKDVDKSYQLDDWRIRPLPSDMIYYARVDTHYLLHIFDVLKNRLIKCGKLMDTYDKSNDRCLTLYEKPNGDPEIAVVKIEKNFKFNACQRYAYKELFKWRDTMAREMDEGLDYVLPNKSLEHLAQVLPNNEMILSEILESNLNSSISPLVQKNISCVLGIITKALEIPLDKDIENPVNPILNGTDLSIAFESLTLNQSSEVSLNGVIESAVPNLIKGQSFRKLPLIPEISELFSSKTNFLRKNITVGPYLNAEHYLDVQFRLLREDFLRSVKSGLNNYLAKKSVYNGVKVHDCIQLLELSENKKLWKLNIPKKLLERINPEESKRFLPGSLLFFTNDNFVKIYFGLICHSQNTVEESNGIFRVRIHGALPIVPWRKGQKFITIECEPYFEPYRSVMFVLKCNNWLEKISLWKYLKNGCGSVRSPKYLSTCANLNVGSVTVDFANPSSWPNAKDIGLDIAQYKAYQAALTQEFVVIQGPPGTGKTYLGLQVVKTLMEEKNMAMWKANEGGPIIIVCYTNHALDQFGEGILDMYTPPEKRNNKTPFRVRKPRIYRLGWNCQSTRLMGYTPQSRKWSGKDVDILLMTTTGASIRIAKLMKLRSRIMIVEEAAEVVESHIVACLTPHIEHLILLGDHQQLRPITASSELTSIFHLDVSLFERMVKNNFPRYQLEVQHRMRPIIRDLITETIYPKLIDHSKVHSYPNVSGMTHNLFFIDHREQELEHREDSFSKSNEYEAKFLSALCLYLLRQGYEPENITVLAMYMSQVKLLKKEIWEVRSISRELRIETADSFQGEENNIILLSLVRSNKTNNIGFMKTNNRICVALSRAKHGLYIIGNMELLAANSDTWNEIQIKLKTNGNIGPKLTLVCNKHEVGVKMEITKPIEFGRTKCHLCVTSAKVLAEVERKRKEIKKSKAIASVRKKLNNMKLQRN